MHSDGGDTESSVTLKKKRAGKARLSCALPKESLSPREVDVCKLLVAGLPLKQVAFQLNISIHTANCHACNAYRKLGVHTRVELCRRLSEPSPAVEIAMIPPEI